MTLIKWEPFRDVGRILEEFPSFPKLEKFGWDLAVDVYEKDNNIIAEMNLPGIDPDQINITVEDNYLRISGAREESREEQNKRYYSKEIKRGSFERLIHLSDPVQKDKVKAEYKNGELTITLPKIAISKGGEKVKIEIKK